MSLDQIKKVAVLGAGTMGNGIAHVFARAGYGVILRDVETRFLDRGIETIGKNLDREVKKEKITAAEKPQILARIQPTTDVSALAAADFAVEAGENFLLLLLVVQLDDRRHGVAVVDGPLLVRLGFSLQGGEGRELLRTGRGRRRSRLAS